MLPLRLTGLIVCWAVAFATAQPANWKTLSDPPAPKAIGAIEARIADLATPEGFFAPEITFADQFGPFVAIGRNTGPKDSRFIYDLRKGEKVAEFTGKQTIDRTAALSPNGTLLASSDGPLNAQAVTVYNVKTGEKVLNFRLEKRVDHLQFIDNERLLSVQSLDNVCVIWDTKTGKELKRITPGRGVQARPAVGPGGNYLALVEGNRVRVFSLKTGEEAAAIDLPKQGPLAPRCHALAFAPDGNHLGGLFEQFPKQRILLWDMATGQLTGDHEVEKPRSPFYDGPKFLWSPDGLGWLVHGEAVYDRESGRLLWKVPEKRGRSQLVAINQVVSLVEVDRKRSVTAHHFPMEQVAKMRELVKAGRNSTDALLPGLTEVTLTGAKRITIPLVAEAWTFKAAAEGDPSRLAARPFKLSINANEVGSLHVGSAASGVLAVEVQPADSAPFLPTKRAVAIERYDLVNGQKLGRLEVKVPARLAGIDPDGKHALLIEAEKGDRLDLWSLTEGKHLAGWRPYAQEAEANRAVTSAFLLSGQRALTINAARKLVLWSLPACKAEYIAEVPNLSHPHLTNNGKFLVGIDTDRVRIFEATTGQPVGDTATAPAADAPREARALAVRPDGTEAAVLFHVPSNTATPWLVARWDLANGKLLGSFSFLAAAGPIQAPSLAYTGNGHLLLDNSQLIDLSRKEVVWAYRMMFGGRVATQPPDGRSWYTVADQPAQPATLVAASLPEEPAQVVIKKVIAANDALVKPGTAIALQTDLAGEQSDRIKDGLRKQAEESLKRLGLTAGDAAGVRLTLKVSERKTGETVEFRKLFPQFGENPLARDKVELMELDYQATLTKDGQTLWQSPKEKAGMRTVGILRLPKDEKDVGKYLRTRMWDQAQAWGSRLNPPRYLVRTTDGLLVLPGTSTLRATGPVPDPPGK